jgi:hypothetical protein
VLARRFPIGSKGVVSEPHFIRLPIATLVLAACPYGRPEVERAGSWPLWVCGPYPRLLYDWGAGRPCLPARRAQYLIGGVWRVQATVAACAVIDLTPARQFTDLWPRSNGSASWVRSAHDMDVHHRLDDRSDHTTIDAVLMDDLELTAVTLEGGHVPRRCAVVECGADQRPLFGVVSKTC